MHTNTRQPSFNINRIWQLIAEDWTEKKKLFGYGLFILLGLLILVAVHWGLTPISRQFYTENYAGQIIRVFYERDLSANYAMGLLVFGALTSLAFNPLKNLNARAAWLIRPGTYFEKMVAIFLVYGVLFLVVYSVLAMGVFKIATLSVESITAEKGLEYIYRSDGPVWEDWTELLPIISMYFGIQALYVLGVFYFKKLPFIKTTLALFIIGVALIYGIGSLSSHFGRSAHFSIMFLDTNPMGLDARWGSDLIGSSFNFYKRYNLTGAFRQVLTFLGKYSWAPFLWVVIWARLRESEIK